MASFLSSPTSPTHSTPLLLFSSAAERILVLSHLQGEGECYLYRYRAAAEPAPSLFSLLLLSLWLGAVVLWVLLGPSRRAGAAAVRARQQESSNGAGALFPLMWNEVEREPAHTDRSLPPRSSAVAPAK